jgi:hypothetical protein
MNRELFQILSQYMEKKYPEIWTSNFESSNKDKDKDKGNGIQKLSEQEVKDAIINGKWDELIEGLKAKIVTENKTETETEFKIESKSKQDDNKNKVIKENLFKLIEQKIQETLYKGNQTEALEILRNHLSPLKIFPDRIHQLAQDILLMRATPVNRYILVQEVFGELRKLKGLILSENRLEELIEDAKEYQKIKCPFHVNNVNDSDWCLWTAHNCQRSGPIKMKAENVQRREILTHSTGELLNLLMSTDGKNVFIIDEDGNVHIYPINDPNFRAINISSHNAIHPITFWPRITDKLPELINREVSISNVLGNEVESKKRFPIENPISIAITADDQFLICSTEGQSTTLFDMKNGKVVHSWIRLRCSHLMTPQNSAEKYFLAVSDHGSILQISTESFETIKTIPSMNERLNVSSVYLDGKRLLVGYNNSTIYYYDDWQGYEHPTRIFRGHSCTKFRVNSILSRYDRNLALSCSENGSIYGWNIETGRLVYVIDLHEKCSNDIMEIGQGQFITCGDDGKLYEWKLYQD